MNYQTINKEKVYFFNLLEISFEIAHSVSEENCF